MARFTRWANLRYARLIAEVKADSEVAAAVDSSSIISVSNTSFQSYIANTNPRITTLESQVNVSNTNFQSYVANTNSRITTLESGGGGGGVDTASSFTYSVLFGGN